jgi:hypothetical protein
MAERTDFIKKIHHRRAHTLHLLESSPPPLSKKADTLQRFTPEAVFFASVGLRLEHFTPRARNTG